MTQHGTRFRALVGDVDRPQVGNFETGSVSQRAACQLFAIRTCEIETATAGSILTRDHATVLSLPTANRHYLYSFKNEDYSRSRVKECIQKRVWA